MKSVFDN